ncbi:MAG: hypothetical protein GY830_04680 [Bacteroidetes bacterium]|nr:hypothetical protein [Bacteroidota bacterium]
MKHIYKVNIVLMFFILQSIEAEELINKVQNKKQIKTKVETKGNDKTSVSKKIDEKQKLIQLKNLEIQLKNLEFEEKIGELRRKIELLRMQKEYEQAKIEADLIEFRKKRISAEKDTVELRIKIEQLKAKLEKSQQELQLANFENEKKMKLLALKTEKAKANIEQINTQAELNKYIISKKLYPDNPLKKDGTLMISDRNIKLDGFVTMAKANYVVDRINFFNNKNPKKPIFLIINMNMGGSIQAGENILKAMKSSNAPVYAVVKSVAASMAAIITTLAKKSFAYPNARILHHQPVFSLGAGMSISSKDQINELKKEYDDCLKRWLGEIAKKMGISLNRFLEQIKKNSADGNWIEYADKAKKLKWVDHIIKGTEYSINKLPDKKDYTNLKYIKEIFDAEDQQLILKKDDNGSNIYYLNSILPGEMFYVLKHSNIIVR